MPGTTTEIQGWVQLVLPTGVSGFGFFRNGLNPAQPQEATVPFAAITAKSVRIVFDDTKYVTAIAISNPTNTAGTVTATVRDANGNALGTGFTLQLAALGRAAFLLKTMAPSVVGQLGSVDFTIDNGAVAPLALRANGAAFTSIIPIVLE